MLDRTELLRPYENPHHRKNPSSFEAFVGGVDLRGALQWRFCGAWRGGRCSASSSIALCSSPPPPPPPQPPRRRRRRRRSSCRVGAGTRGRSGGSGSRDRTGTRGRSGRRRSSASRTGLRSPGRPRGPSPSSSSDPAPPRPRLGLGFSLCSPSSYCMKSYLSWD